MAAITSSIPSPRAATVLSTGGRQRSGSLRSPRLIMCRRSRTVASAPSRSALFTTKMSPISRIPALAASMPSPISAPPENGEEGSTARMPTRLPRPRKAPTSAFVKVDLSTPGLPVMPKMCARPVCCASAAITSRRAGWPSSTSEISRATARGAPALAASTRAGTSTGLLAIMKSSAWRPALSSLLGNAHDQCVSLPATTAQGSRTDTATTAFELKDKVQGDPGPRHADGVPDGDGASVDVDLVGVDPQKLGGCQPHRGERLVDLNQVEIGGGDALLGTGRHNGPGRLTLQR